MKSTAAVKAQSLQCAPSLDQAQNASSCRWGKAIKVFDESHGCKFAAAFSQSASGLRRWQGISTQNKAAPKTHSHPAMLIAARRGVISEKLSEPIIIWRALFIHCVRPKARERGHPRPASINAYLCAASELFWAKHESGRQIDSKSSQPQDKAFKCCC